MKPRIVMKKIWSDEDLIELRITVHNGMSTFFNDVYIAHKRMRILIEDLLVFRNRIYGGVFDLRFGEFGPEYADGAFQARLHFQPPGKLFISTHQQSEFEEFSIKKVASEAKMYLITEPILLDDFIDDLKCFDAGTLEEVMLKCIWWR